MKVQGILHRILGCEVLYDDSKVLTLLTRLNI